MQDCENRVSAERLTEVPALRLRGEVAGGDRVRAAGQDVAQGKNLPPSPGGYRMHISRFGLSAVCPLALLRGPLPSIRRPREGGNPSLTKDAAAAGKEEAGPPGPAPDPDPGLPREPRLGPGSEAGATPAFARAGGWGNATPRHQAEMCESGSPAEAREGGKLRLHA